MHCAKHLHLACRPDLGAAVSRCAGRAGRRPFVTLLLRCSAPGFFSVACMVLACLSAGVSSFMGRGRLCGGIGLPRSDVFQLVRTSGSIEIVLCRVTEALEVS